VSGRPAYLHAVRLLLDVVYVLRGSGVGDLL